MKTDRNLNIAISEYTNIIIRGWSFSRPDTRSEGFLRGLKIFLENLRAMKYSWKFLRGPKFSYESLSTSDLKNKGSEICRLFFSRKMARGLKFWDFVF